MLNKKDISQPLINFISIDSVFDLKNRYPNAYKYILNKNPDYISIEKMYVKVGCYKYGIALVYDQFDIIELDKIKR